MNQHIKSIKHCKNTNQEIKEKKKYVYDDMQNYQKEYNEYRKEKGKQNIWCETCNKYIKTYNLSHHKKTEKHKNKLNNQNNNNYDNYNYEEVEILQN
jgi:hypothetical protein